MAETERSVALSAVFCAARLLVDSRIKEIKCGVANPHTTYS